jgi:hypothetical protein
VSGGRQVEVRAFRGTRRTSVYCEHRLADEDFVRIHEAAAARGLPLLASLDPCEPHELDKDDAQRLAEEMTDVRRSGDVPDLDDDLTALTEVARWCARATKRSWLKIEGP